MKGDADIARIGSLLGEPARARMLMALADGRALPASALAREAGVAASTASEHFRSLTQACLLSVEPYGRHRYYRLAGPRVAMLLEAAAQIAPPARVRSLKEAQRSEALRVARTCYDHLAGRLGCDLMSALLAGGFVAGGDGRFHSGSLGADRLSAPGRDVAYRLTPTGRRSLAALGLDVDRLTAGRRPLVRYCVDWTEQRHHLAGALGAALLARLLELGWVCRRRAGRAVSVTHQGQAGLRDRFGLVWDPARP